MKHGKKIVLYLSGPLTLGDRSHNVCQFMQAHERLMRAGFAVWNPGLTGLLPWAWEIPHEEWIASDLLFVERCDMLIRLPGESVGADMEVAHAKDHGIPVWVVLSLEELDRPAVIVEECLV